MNSELFGHFRGTTTIGYLRVKKNDLILSAQNLHLGNANVNLRFEHGIISPAYKVYDLIDCNPEFIQAWVKKEDTKNFFLAATTEGASQCRKNIEWATLGKQTIAMPSLQEQTELGAFFTHLDNLITLHQRESYKYSLCHHDLSDVLECLLTIYWEQRKLGEVADIVGGGTPSTENSNKRNAFDIEKYLSRQLKLRLEEEYEAFEISISDNSRDDEALLEEWTDTTQLQAAGYGGLL